MLDTQLAPARPNAAATEWSVKLQRRLAGLKPGRYQITLTIDDHPNWTVTQLGKVEK